MNERIKYQVFGGVLLAVIALFVAGTIAAYHQDFTPVVHVTLDTDHAGNQLDTGADVKVRGVLVGEVRSIRSTGSGAQLDLALQPDKVGLIPTNVTAQLLPKTLFGERYVALQLPTQPSGTHLAAGDVIAQDHSTTSIEVEKVLSDLMPLLQAVRPQQLAATLDAMSAALSGRGQQLGQTLVALNGYLTNINPSLPDLNADIKRLAAVSDTFDKAAPQLLQALSELTTTSRTIVDEQNNLRAMYATVTNASADLGDFLRVNENNLINLVTTSTPTLDVLARYAPEYPCLLKELVDSIPGEDLAFGKGTSHPNSGQFTIVIAASRGKYLPGVDTPRYNDDRGPRCYPETVPPNRFPQYPPGGPVNDGSTHGPPPNGTGNGTLQSLLPNAMQSTQSTSPQSAATVPQVANSPAERQLVATLLAPQLGVMPADVPGWASELVGPVFRGMEVTVR
ncbi:MAG TPA: MCE family protein [Pseudonocardiaceae bacterium]|jgi:virulence factor Mce-like protein|nr:MCE family protein [Pseudonocardiaceae bacterium]